MTLRLETGLATPAMLLRRLATLPALLMLLAGNVGLLPTTAGPGVHTSGVTTWSTPGAVRHRWHLEDGGRVDVLDLGFGVLTLPEGHAAQLLDRVLPADAHYEAVASEQDPDLIS